MDNLNPYQLTILEEDELFYRTFPDARPPPQQPQRIDIDFYPLYPYYSPPPPYCDPPRIQDDPDPLQQPQPTPTPTQQPQRKPRASSRPLRNPRSPSAELDSPPWTVPGEPSPPPSMRLDPAPTKRPLAKKPPLACLFCRGRKIACGPPLPGSDEKSCNQCQRRTLVCQYPSESRRGMRKKKVPESGPSTPQEHATPPVSP